MRHVVIGAVIAFACSGGPTQPDAVPGKPFEVRAGESAALPDGLTVRFDSVESDSRCPIDVTCIRAGEAVIVVRLSEPGNTPAVQELQTDPPDRRSARYSRYEITLTSLMPFPRSDRPTPPSEYVATLVVNIR